MNSELSLRPATLADRLLAADVLSQLLAAADPGQLGDSLTQQVRELTGARTVMVIAHLEDTGQHRLLGVCPARRVTLFTPAELGQLCPKGTTETLPYRTVDLSAKHPLRALLSRVGVASLMRFPLRVGNELLGTLLLLDLPALDRVDDTRRMVTLILPVTALALKGSLAHEQIEQQARELSSQTHDLELHVAERTAELVTENKALADARVAALQCMEDAVAARQRAEHLTVELQREVEERKQAEEEILRLRDELEERVVSRTAQLEAANEELESFAYSVSHDLRAPLRAIDGFSQMVADDAADRLTPEDVEHLQRVRRAAQRMASLIDDLLGLSRTSRQDLLRQEVDLSATATAVLEELREAEPDRRVEVVVPPGLKANADPALLRVILSNLLGNAWKFTGKHAEGRIEVGICDAGGERAFFVRDDGAGFDMRTARHVFGAFQRFHAADDFEGNGIGLATVQRLVARHGGHVWAESEVEEGSTFYFTLAAPSDSI